MLLLMLSTACAGLFGGAALYVNLVEHPARMSCGSELALREFAPSYQRATILQLSLATGGLTLGLTAAWRLRDPWVAVGAALLGASIPFTLIIVFLTNKQLLDPTLDWRSPPGHEPVASLESPARHPVPPKRHGLRSSAFAGTHALSQFFVTQMGPSHGELFQNRIREELPTTHKGPAARPGLENPN